MTKMENFKIGVFIEFIAMLVTALFHIGFLIAGVPYPLILYPIIFGIVLLCILLVVFILIPIGDWFLD